MLCRPRPTLQILAVFAVVAESVGEYNHENLVEQWTQAASMVRGLHWSDYAMFALVCMIMGLSVATVLVDVHFVRLWVRINGAHMPTGARRALVRFLLWALTATRAFLLVPTVLASLPMIVFDEGAAAWSRRGRLRAGSTSGRYTEWNLRTPGAALRTLQEPDRSPTRGAF